MPHGKKLGEEMEEQITTSQRQQMRKSIVEMFDLYMKYYKDYRAAMVALQMDLDSLKNTQIMKELGYG